MNRTGQRTFGIVCGHDENAYRYGPRCQAVRMYIGWYINCTYPLKRRVRANTLDTNLRGVYLNKSMLDISRLGVDKPVYTSHM